MYPIGAVLTYGLVFGVACWLAGYLTGEVRGINGERRRVRAELEAMRARLSRESGEHVTRERGRNVLNLTRAEAEGRRNGKICGCSATIEEIERARAARGDHRAEMVMAQWDAMRPGVN